MLHNLELLKADIRDELDKIERLEKEFSRFEDKLSLPPEAVPNYDRGAIGYFVHNFYNGCENIFRSVARFFENDLGSDARHADLLKRMKLEVAGYRSPVIGEDLFRRLDDFRAFRHKFRHCYGFELDWEKERLIARRLRPTARLFREEIHRFLKSLESIEGP